MKLSKFCCFFSGQNIANMGLMYLCDSLGGENHKMPDILMQVTEDMNENLYGSRQ